VTAASNAVGTVPDLPGIVAAAHARGARVYVDAVHAAPHRRLDVPRSAATRWLLGLQVVRAARRDPLREPGSSRRDQARSAAPGPRRSADSWEQGTAAFESLAGVRAAADYVQSVGFDAIGAHEHALLERALGGLEAIDGVTLYGTAAERAPTIMFRVSGVHPTEAAAALAERGVAVWHGNYYAHELERFLDLAPTARCAPASSTTTTKTTSTGSSTASARWPSARLTWSDRQHRPAEQRRDRRGVLARDEVHAGVARAAVDAQRRSNGVAGRRVDQDTRRPADGQLPPLRARARAAAQMAGASDCDGVDSGTFRQLWNCAFAEAEDATAGELPRPAGLGGIRAAMNVAAFAGLTAIIGVGLLADV
jgi:hypothetical protein